MCETGRWVFYGGPLREVMGSHPEPLLVISPRYYKHYLRGSYQKRVRSSTEWLGAKPVYNKNVKNCIRVLEILMFLSFT